VASIFLFKIEPLKITNNKCKQFSVNRVQPLSSINFHPKMSSISLYIGYARKDCDKSLVAKTFAAILGADYIEDIYESNKKDPFGKPHKTYKLTFKNTPALQEIADRITREYFIKVAYKLEWDWKTRKYVERYWKVFNYVSPEAAFKPHIMESQPYAEITQDELLSIQKRLSSIYGPEDSKTSDEEDTANDFEELAQAVAHFGEDYPGCIAKKIPKPPPLTRSDDPEEIVLKCDQMYDAESEEWNELKDALEAFSGKPITFVRSNPPFSERDTSPVIRIIPPISEWDNTPLKPPILRRATALQSEELLWGIPQGHSHIEQIWGEQVPPPPLYTRAENTSHNIR